MVNTRVSATTSTITNDKKRLHFNEKLVGKGLTTDALLKRLKTLHTELARFDQEEVDVKSLSSIRKELISSSLVLHRDKGVKAYAACCLADILGLYAPDAPYTQEELKDIFQFFFTQLAKGLVRNDAYYEQYFYLLDSLAKCKSVVLVCDLPNADELLVQVFDDFFTIVKQNVVKNIEMAMSDILCALIDECQSIPTDVLDTVMAQFTEKNAGMEQAGYRLALEVCTSRADRLQRYVCQYFTDIIIQTSSEEELDDLRKAHDLIRQLNRAAPGLLINVVPQLEEQLRVDTLTLRIMATQTLGGMFGDKNGASLAQRHTSTWSAWTNRRNDKAHTVRIALLELVPDVLMAQPELRRDLAETLDLKLEDPDDRVRVAVCKAYAKLDYESLLHTVEVGHLHRLAERVKDKKPNVRTEALATLGKLYKVAFSEIEKNSNAALQHFAWIPERLLEAMRLSADVKQDVETAMAEIILPLPPKGEDEVAWTERLLLVMHCFENEESVGLLLSLAGLKQPRPSPTPFVRFMDYSKAYNGGTINEDEQQVKRNLALCVQKLAAMYFSDRARATEDLNKFGKAENENYMYQVARRIVDPSVDLKTLAKSLAEFSRRIEQSLGPETVETLLRLARTAALWVVNGSSVPTLLSKFKVHVKVSKNAPRMSMSDATALDGQKHAKVLFQALCKRCPEALKVHLPEFSVALMDEKNVELAELALQGIAAIAVLDSKLAPKEKLVLDRIIKYATGKNPRHVKFAARILARLPKPDKCEQVLKTMSTKLSNANPETVLAHITAFAQFAKYAPETFEAQSDSIINFVIPNVLMESCPSSSDEMEVDSEDDWAEDSALPELARAKLTALKMCRNRCLAQQGTKTAEDVTGPALKLIFTILEHNGSVQENADDSGKVRTRMRFQAAICLLQLAQVPSYAQQIVKQFTLLALTIQDPCYNVRMGFLQKYTALSMKLETRFYCIPFLTAQDPERETREYARNFVTIQYQRMPPEQRHAKLEMVFVRYLHLLAHHPDFTSRELETLQDMCRYVEFYVDTVCSEENLALLYCLAQRCKSVRDSESHAASENLYILSEMAQEIIKGRAQHHGWVLDSFPGKFKLPVDIFKALPTVETAKKIATTTYLNEEMTEWLENHNKPVKSPQAKPLRATKKRKAKYAAEGSSPLKKTRTSKGPKTRRKNEWSGSDNGEDSDSPIEDSDDDLVIEPPVITRGSKSRPVGGTKAAKLAVQAESDEESADEEIEKDEAPLAPVTTTRTRATPRRASAAKVKVIEEDTASSDAPMETEEEEEEEEEEEKPVAKTSRTRAARAVKAEPKTKTTPAKRGKK